MAQTTPRDAPPTPPAPASAESRKLTLADAERSALALQPQVLAARSQLQGAEGASEQARAPLLPQVTGVAQYTRETGNFAPRPGAVPGGTAAAPSASLSRSYDYWNFGVTGTQLIYDFGQTYEKYRSAGQTEAAQRDNERAVRLQVLAAVRSAYFVARGDRDLVDVARETLADQEKHLTQVQGFVQAGTQPAIALAQQRSAVASARVQLVAAQNVYDTAKAQLNQAAGIRGDTDYDVADEGMPAVQGEDEPLDSLLAQAVAARPEMQGFARQRAAQQAAISSARGGYGPRFSAAAGLGAARR
jgi:outer membrane protein